MNIAWTLTWDEFVWNYHQTILNWMHTQKMIQSYIIFILYSSTDYIYHLPIVEPFRKRTIQGCGQATYPSEFRLDWCVGEQCFDHSISCAQFQMRLKAYYQDVQSWEVLVCFLLDWFKGKSTENHGVLLQNYQVSYGFLQICLTPSLVPWDAPPTLSHSTCCWGSEMFSTCGWFWKCADRKWLEGLCISQNWGFQNF